VFATGNGNPMSTRNFHRSYYRFLSDAGLPVIHFKAFRHMQATLTDGFHAPIKTTQAHMGHSDIKTTLNYHTHETKSVQRPIAKQADEYMKNAMESVKTKAMKAVPTTEEKPTTT
jgi:integrase